MAVLRVAVQDLARAVVEGKAAAPDFGKVEVLPAADPAQAQDREDQEAVAVAWEREAADHFLLGYPAAVLAEADTGGMALRSAGPRAAVERLILPGQVVADLEVAAGRAEGADLVRGVVEVDSNLAVAVRAVAGRVDSADLVRGEVAQEGVDLDSAQGVVRAAALVPAEVVRAVGEGSAEDKELVEVPE